MSPVPCIWSLPASVVWPCCSAVQVQQLISKTVEQLGGVDIMVANAGIVKTAPFLEMTEADFDAVLSVNLKVCQLHVFDLATAIDRTSWHTTASFCWASSASGRGWLLPPQRAFWTALHLEHYQQLCEFVRPRFSSPGMVRNHCLSRPADGRAI